MRDNATAPLIDQQLLENHRNAVGPELLREVLREFESSSGGYLIALVASLGAGRQEEARLAAHRLAGVAGMLGFIALKEVCEAIEQAPLGAARTRLTEEAESVDLLYKQTLGALDEYRR